MHRAHGRWLIIVLVLVSLVGCGPSAPASVPPTPGPTATPAPTPAPTPVPSSPAAAELIARKKNLAAGRYTRTGFVPRVTFEVDGSWRGVQLLGGFFDIQQEVGTPDVIAVQFARPDGIYQGPGKLMAPSTAEAAVDWLQANPALTVLGRSGSLLSGLAGAVVEVENPPTATEPAQIVHVPPGPLVINPGRRLWIAFFDTPEGLLAIMVGGSAEKWDDALLAAEPVLETVTIGF